MPEPTYGPRVAIPHGATHYGPESVVLRVPITDDMIERAAEALSAWPLVAVDDRKHQTATHMARAALTAALRQTEAPDA